MQQSQFAEVFNQLVESLDQLPGIGPNAAKRLARFIVTERQSTELADLITLLHTQFRPCPSCQVLTHSGECSNCSAINAHTLLIVEHADDVIFWSEQGFDGGFFVLSGLLSPMSGRGPAQLGLSALKQLLMERQPERVWLQLQPSVEATATEQFIRHMLTPTPVVCWQVDG